MSYLQVVRQFQQLHHPSCVLAPCFASRCGAFQDGLFITVPSPETSVAERTRKSSTREVAIYADVRWTLLGGISIKMTTELP